MSANYQHKGQKLFYQTWLMTLAAKYFVNINSNDNWNPIAYTERQRRGSKKSLARWNGNRESDLVQDTENVQTLSQWDPYLLPQLNAHFSW